MRAKNYDNVLSISILKYSPGPEKLPGLSRNGPLIILTNLNWRWKVLGKRKNFFPVS